MRALLVLLAAAAGVVALAVLRPEPDEPRPPAAAPARPADPPPARVRRAPHRPVRRARCPAGLAGCREATGRVIYVEAVDPDGDGDAHYVLAGGNITGPGLTVIDVGPHLRPRRLPRPGDMVSAAGPVFTGTFGQKQIEAVEVHQRRRR